MRELGFACEDDRERLLELYDLCFPGEHGFGVWFHEHVRRLDRTLVCREDGRIIAMMDLLEPEMKKDGEIVKTVYLYAVGTDPAYRGQGIMGSMIEHACELARAWGDEIAVLLVQNEGLFRFYSRFGFEPVFSVSRIMMDVEPPSFMCKAAMLDSKYADALTRLYDALTAGRPAVRRTEDDFRALLDEYGDHFYGLFSAQDELMAWCVLDDEDRHGVEVMGYGAGYLLYVCCTDETDAWGRGLPTGGEDDIPVGCARALTERGAAFLRSGLRPYINLLHN